MLLEDSSLFTRLFRFFFLLFVFLAGDRDRDRDFDRGLFFLALFRDRGRFLFLGDFERSRRIIEDLERSRRNGDDRDRFGDDRDRFGDDRDRFNNLEFLSAGDRDRDFEGDHDL